MHAENPHVSDLNPTAEDLVTSYMEGRKFAAVLGFPDTDNTLEMLEAERQNMPTSEYEDQKEMAQADSPACRHVWHAMFASGMHPFEHYDTLITEALAAGRSVQFIDPSHESLGECAKCVPYSR